MLLSTQTLATTNCKYTHQVGGNFTHKIESMTNYQRKVFPYIEDTRACVVSMNVKIEGTEYHTKGKFVFGPDQTETNACMHAEVRAKENIIKIVSPEILTGTTTMDCTPDEKPVVVSQKDIYEKTILPVYKIYQQKLTELNSCDFGDLILHVVKIFEKNIDIRNIYSKNFKYILVDEYQDTNFVQSKWLNLLVGTNKNICCVGDDDQSIYSWRGAEIKNFLEFDQIYEKTKIIRLEQNYRSTQNILSVASN